MKQKVRFSAYSLILMSVLLIIFVAGFFALHDNTSKLTLFCIIMSTVTIAGLYNCPTSIEADDSGIVLHRLLSSPKVFRYDTIQSVEPCFPSLGGLRLCACGGYFGYWGYFHDILIGYYIGYYGSRKNCILVKMEDGKQYVIGCDDAYELVYHINSRKC